MSVQKVHENIIKRIQQLEEKSKEADEALNKILQRKNEISMILAAIKATALETMGYSLDTHDIDTSTGKVVERVKHNQASQSSD